MEMFHPLLLSLFKKTYLFFHFQEVEVSNQYEDRQISEDSNYERGTNDKVLEEEEEFHDLDSVDPTDPPSNHQFEVNESSLTNADLD